MSNVANIKGVGIKEGDIVKIKWKPLQEIIDFYKREGIVPSTLMHDAKLDENVSAIVNDGHYLVESVTSGNHSRSVPLPSHIRREKECNKPEEITIINHNSFDGYDFTFNEFFVDEISVEHDVAEHYFSDKFNLSVMKIDGALFINGQMLTKSDAKLIDILENTVSDLAIQKMLEESEK